MNNDIDCPYCGVPQEINHDDGYGYEEDKIHEQQCGYCDQHFTFTTSISFYYRAHQADCLNGQEHKFMPTHTHPKIYTRMRCEDCDEVRRLTEIEWLDFLEPMESV